MILRRAFIALLLLPAAAVAAAAPLDFARPARRIPELVPEPERADRLLVEKRARRLTLLRDGRVLRRYVVALGPSPIGDKEREGDGRTPEGRYAIDFKNERSAFHLSLRISYPDAADRDAARRRGVLPGGEIMLHGLPNGLAIIGPLHRAIDWTDGCIAVTNGEIEEIWAMTDVGTAIEIRE
jgi:murein L,D-transpeptidase YafK